MSARRIALSVAFILTSAVCSFVRAAEVEVFFSPNGGAAQRVAVEIRAAKKEIRVAAYSINEDEIVLELIEASKRGVDVQMIVDRGQEGVGYSKAHKVKKGGVKTLTDDRHQLFHDKYIEIDGEKVITGSMNFTNSGSMKNAENTLIITDQELAKKYKANWEAHAQHSRNFKRKEPKVIPPSPPLENLIPQVEPAQKKGD